MKKGNQEQKLGSTSWEHLCFILSQIRFNYNPNNVSIKEVGKLRNAAINNLTNNYQKLAGKPSGINTIRNVCTRRIGLEERKLGAKAIKHFDKLVYQWLTEPESKVLQQQILANLSSRSPNLKEEVINFFKSSFEQTVTNKSVQTIEVTDHQVELKKFEADLQKKVEESLKLTVSERTEKLPKPPNKPKKIRATKIEFDRNQHVIASVLLRAKGICEYCKQPAPFRRKKDNTPYLEVHHKERLAEGGDDTVENAVALCPNCHRGFHYGFDEKFQFDNLD